MVLAKLGARKAWHRLLEWKMARLDCREVIRPYPKMRSVVGGCGSCSAQNCSRFSGECR